LWENIDHRKFSTRLEWYHCHGDNAGGRAMTSFRKTTSVRKTKSLRKLTLKITIPVGLSALAGSIVAALAGVWALPVLAQQQAAPPVFSPPVFSWDLTVGWIGMGEFRPVPGKVPPVTNDPKYPYVPNNNQGRQPTYRIADLTNPNLKPWVKEVMKKDNDEVLAGKIAFTPGSSCTLAGVPGFLYLGGAANPYRFIQTPKEVYILRDYDSQVRRVALNVPHSANPKPSWYGESVGHYEGDTLVIDTIGLNAKTFVDYYRTPHSEKLHVVERWRMIDDGKAMQVTFTVTDPETYYEPWSAMRRFRRVERGFGEQICAEGNRNLFDYKIPVASTADF
jgi:hypothetical protein